ncbi:hypothetical protein ACFL0U_01295 [Pseudomonadota bacterium]
MKFEVKPHEGVNNLKFGMTPGEVKKIMGEPDKIRNPNKYGNSTRYFYFDIDFFLDFNKDNELFFFEFGGFGSVFFKNIKLTNKDFKNTLEQLKDLGYEFYEDPEDLGAYCFDSIGICVYSPSGVFQSLSVYPKGLYDK